MSILSERIKLEEGQSYFIVYRHREGDYRYVFGKFVRFYSDPGDLMTSGCWYVFQVSDKEWELLAEDFEVFYTEQEAKARVINGNNNVKRCIEESIDSETRKKREQIEWLKKKNEEMGETQ